jgi:hypothetical protein
MILMVAPLLFKETANRRTSHVLRFGGLGRARAGAMGRCDMVAIPWWLPKLGGL